MKKRHGCEPLKRYCEIHGISREELASKLKRPAPTVRGWVNGHRAVSAETAVHVEKMIGIPREAMRPDLFFKRPSE